MKRLGRVLFRDMTIESTRALTRALVPTLTHALAPSITQSLTHSPKSDYYCHYCKERNVYCSQCHAAKYTDYANDYYANYYASYFADYYTENYVRIGDMFSEQALAS